MAVLGFASLPVPSSKAQRVCGARDVWIGQAPSPPLYSFRHNWTVVGGLDDLYVFT